MSKRHRAAAIAEPMLIERREHVAILTLNRPEARNTLSEALLAALQRAIDDMSTDATVRAVVLTATGPAFSAGHDLKEMTLRRADADGGRAYVAQIMAQCATMMQAIVKCPKPFIAAVQATAVAAGCQLVATCDLAVAAEDAKFGTTGINNGLFCSTPSVALSRNISRKRAMELLLIGGLISAREALDFGLVNRVVPAERLMRTAIDLAERIADKSPAAIALGKELFYAQAEEALAQAYGTAAEAMVRNWMLHDADEGIAAFIEKRKPDWKGC
jgi:enoyl-CoA hydratase/carnithine racemase